MRCLLSVSALISSSSSSDKSGAKLKLLITSIRKTNVRRSIAQRVEWTKKTKDKRKGAAEPDGPSITGSDDAQDDAQCTRKPRWSGQCALHRRNRAELRFITWTHTQHEYSSHCNDVLRSTLEKQFAKGKRGSWSNLRKTSGSSFATASGKSRRRHR